MTVTRWNCPSCHRHVPVDLAECRCGFTRDQAEKLIDRKAVARSEGSGMKGPLIVALVMVLVAIAWGFFYRPSRTPIAPVLGIAEPSAPPANVRNGPQPRRRP